MNSSESKTLYYSDSALITKKDIINALTKLGVKKGDIILIHSDIGVFGKLATFDKNFLLQSIIDSFKEVVGESGTIVMPTFTYSFLKNKPFDVAKSKSTVGTLTEYFRQQPEVKRTIHPTHSVAIWGKYKNSLLNIGKGTFNKTSIFGKLHELHCKIIFFGVSFHKSCTHIHYIEEIHGVPYRYVKKIKGKIIVDKKEYEYQFLFYCRYAFVINSFLRLEKRLKKVGLLKEVRLGNSLISITGVDDMFNEGYKLLDKDRYFFLKEDTIAIRIYNRVVCFLLDYTPWPIRILNDIASKLLRFFRFKFYNQNN